MRYKQFLTNCFIPRFFSESGPKADFSKSLSQITSSQLVIRDWVEKDSQPFLKYSRNNSDISVIKKYAHDFRERFKKLVVIGIGGASLGAQALTAIRSTASRSKIKLVYFDNLDANQVAVELAQTSDTGFLVVSKSGSTLETIAQTLLALDNADPDQFLFITEPGESPLRSIGLNKGIVILDHDPKLGGRFSVFSLVGMLPAMVAGLDIEKIREGGNEILDSIMEVADPSEIAPIASAAMIHAISPKISTTVIMPYDDRLLYFSHWVCQLWAESLGKSSRGLTPVVARGATDQHSQLQLYLDGPPDKIVTIISVEPETGGHRIRKDLAEIAETKYLSGRNLSEVIAVEAKATKDALVTAGRPVREIVLSKVDEFTVGALMMHFMLETVLVALTTETHPFDQPAVERGKKLAREYLWRISK